MSGDDSDMGELVIDEKLNLTSCTARFNGTIDKETTEGLIAKIENFKHVQTISDESALRDLSSLFEGTALTWWNGVKDAVKSWDDAITLVRYVYGPTKPPHLIYAEIFSQKQDDMAIDQFINRKRKQFLQLPKPHPEDVQLDMIYWMMNRTVTSNIPRESIDTLDQLVQKARLIERELPQGQGQTNGKKKRKRCGFCRINGHLTEECRKRQKKVAEMEANQQKTESINVRIKEENY